MPERALDRVPMPEAVAALPRDERGYPIPFFVAYVAGKPDPRVSDGFKYRLCVKYGRCWICGRALGLGRLVAFVGGPLSATNRAYGEPPSHPECAHYAARVCPFLVGETKRRGIDCTKAAAMGLPPPPPEAVFTMIERTSVYECRSYRVLRRNYTPLLLCSAPVRLTWYERGEVVEDVTQGVTS